MRALKAILTACGNLRRQLDWPEDQLGLRSFFGMRALKAILTACGNLRRQLDWPEDQLGLRSLNDVNLPKFT